MKMSFNELHKLTSFLTNLFCQHTHPFSSRHQTIACIILTQYQPTLSTRGEHSVWFICSLRDEIINHYTNISILTAENQWFTTLNRECSVNAGHYTLSSRLFIASCTINLSSKEKTTNTLRFKTMTQFSRINSIVFDSIGVFEEFRILQARNGTNHLFLNIARKRTGKTVRIYDIAFKIFRFKHHMMPGSILEANYLILNRRTIPHTCTLDWTAVKG